MSTTVVSGAAISTLWRSTDPVAVEAEDMTWFIASPMADSSISVRSASSLSSGAVWPAIAAARRRAAATGMSSRLPPSMPST